MRKRFILRAVRVRLPNVKGQDYGFIKESQKNGSLVRNIKRRF